MAEYLVLARKYRSTTFDEVVGQEPIAADAEERHRGRAGRPRLPVHRHARRGQDHHGPHPGQGPELPVGRRPDGHALRQVRRLPWPSPAATTWT